MTILSIEYSTHQLIMISSIVGLNVVVEFDRWKQAKKLNGQKSHLKNIGGHSTFQEAAKLPT